jgi:septum formation topological specificity factor MinE
LIADNLGGVKENFIKMPEVGDGEMNEIEILEEIVKIQRKYLTVVESMGTITMSPQDKNRITFLEAELKKIRNK